MRLGCPMPPHCPARERTHALAQEQLSDGHAGFLPAGLVCRLRFAGTGVHRAEGDAGGMFPPGPGVAGIRSLRHGAKDTCTTDELALSAPGVRGDFELRRKDILRRVQEDPDLAMKASLACCNAGAGGD
eukprot:6209074-Pleurochrysis_carterae.AAC.1